MADIMFNIARGDIKSLIGANDLEIVLLKAVEADATLADYDDLSALLGAAGNTEADFTNYARKAVLNANVTITVDDANERLDIDIPDQVWSSAGNGTNNTLVKLLICANQGAGDVNRIPLTAHDFSATTDGTDLTAVVPADGFYRSS